MTRSYGQRSRRNLFRRGAAYCVSIGAVLTALCGLPGPASAAASRPSPTNAHVGPPPAATVKVLPKPAPATAGKVLPATLLPASLTIPDARIGDTYLEHKELHLPANVAPARGDVLICFDLTGSMSEELNNVKNNAINIMNAVQALIPDVRFGVVSHMDYPGEHTGCGWTSVYGDAGTNDTPYSLDIGLSDNLAMVESAIVGLTLGYGADEPEDYTRVLYEAANDPAIGWRPGAKKIVLLWGDAMPHDCAFDGVLGGTLTTGIDPGRDEADGSADDLEILPVLNELAAANISLISLHSGADNNVWSAYTAITGGASYEIGADGTLPAGVDIAQFIGDSIGANIATIGQLTLDVCTPGYASWLTNVVPAGYTGVVLADPHDLLFDITLRVPPSATAGLHQFDVCAIGDGAEYARQHVSITVTAGQPGGGECNWFDVTMPPLPDPLQVGNGASWADYDSDGDDDLFLANDGANRLLRNDGGANFTDIAFDPAEIPCDTRGAAWGDYDNDGDPDLYVANWDGPNILYRNDGGTLVDVTGADLIGNGQCNSAAWADYDRDGDLDLFVAAYEVPNRLLRNDGNDVFTLVDSAVALTEKSCGSAWGDYDDDGDPDLYVSVEDSPNHLYRNDNGILVEATPVPLDDAGNGKGVAWGDCDNDGDLDLYLANVNAPSRLFLNDGNGGFSLPIDGVVANDADARSCGWADYDNDGWQDLFVSSFTGNHKLFRNLGGAAFADSTCGTLRTPVAAWGMSWNDFDGDGEQDIYLTSHIVPGLDCRLYRNDLNTGNAWLRIDLVGVASNRAGIGAKVTVTDHVSGQSQVREISAGSSYLSQPVAAAQFGLGRANRVDVTVRWPSGTVQTLVNQAVNQRLAIVEGSWAAGIPGAGEPFAYRVSNHPNPFNPRTEIEFSLPQAGAVSLSIFDVEGRLVSRLLDGEVYGSGTFSVEWTGTDASGRALGSGVYYYRFSSAKHVESGRMVLLK